MMRKISTVIPVYNSENTIKRAIDSALYQKPAPFEIIVIDDGSTDASPDIITEYGSKIKYIRQVNSGPSAARNTGIQAAQGDWIAFLDADDYWLPQKTTFETNFMDLYPKIQWFSSNYYMNDYHSNQKYLRNTKNFSANETPFHIFSQPLDALLSGIGWDPTGLCIKRQLLNKQGGFSIGLSYAEDLDLFLSLTKYETTVGYINTPLSIHSYGDPGGLCFRLPITQQIDILMQLFGKHSQLLANNDLQNKLSHFFQALCLSKILENIDNISLLKLWKYSRIVNNIPFTQKKNLWKLYLHKMLNLFNNR